MSEKKYNLKLSALWGTKYEGLYFSMPVDAMVFDALQQVEKGGKLVFRAIPEERRKHDKSPHAYLEYMSKEEVEASSKFRGKPKAAAAEEDDI